MPYSITTKDGLTINNIPDDVAPDAPELKQRVAALRAGKNQPEPVPQEQPKPPKQIDTELNIGEKIVSALPKTFKDWLSNPSIAGIGLGKGSAVHGAMMGNADIPVGAVQLAANAIGQGDAVNKAIADKEKDYDAARAGQGREGFDAARLAGSFTNPTAWYGGGEVKAAQTVGQLAKAGAKVGAVFGAASPVTNGGENYWTDKAIQTGGGAVGGAVLTPVASKVGESVAKGVQSISNKVRPSSIPNIDVATENTLRTAFDDLGSVPAAIRDSVKRQVEEAFNAGQRKLDPAALIRKAQFEAVGLTDDAAPTLGQMTRDPMQFAQEKNLSGVLIKTPKGQGNPLSDRFAEQNKRLQDVFNQVGADNATDRVTAGQTMINALKEADKPVKASVDDLYSTARSMNGGRSIDLDRAAFSTSANDAIDSGMLNHFLPNEVRNLLNQVSKGEGPFNVESAVQIDSLLSSAQRKAQQSGDDAGAMAVGKVRDALHGTPFVAPEADQAGRVFENGVQVSENTAQDAIKEGQAARDAFDQARGAARSRFATIENTPALKAALDDVAPDKFVQNYILGANVRDIEAMKKVLQNSPEALAQARAQIAEHLKHAAFKSNASGDKEFAANTYLETLRSIGKQKLEAFFTPAEVVRLNLAGKVASDINSIPAGAKSGTNTSGTGAAVLNALQSVAESPLLRKFPVSRMIANQAGEIRTERLINNALLPKPGEPVIELSPQVRTAIGNLRRGASQTGGLLGGASVN